MSKNTSLDDGMPIASPLETKDMALLARRAKWEEVINDLSVSHPNWTAEIVDSPPLDDKGQPLDWKGATFDEPHLFVTNDEIGLQILFSRNPDDDAVTGNFGIEASMKRNIKHRLEKDGITYEDLVSRWKAYKQNRESQA